MEKAERAKVNFSVIQWHEDDRLPRKKTQILAEPKVGNSPLSHRQC